MCCTPEKLPHCCRHSRCRRMCDARLKLPQTQQVQMKACCTPEAYSGEAYKESTSQ